MGEKKRPTIVIMLANTQSEYSEELISGFYTCAKEEDINLIFLMGPQMPQYCAEILAGSFSWDYYYQFHTVYDYEHFIKPDALIVSYGSLAAFRYIPDRKEFLERYQGTPSLLMADIEHELDMPYLIAGNYDGMRMCVEHLVVDHGYHRIGFVGGPERNFDSKERLRAYRDVLSEHEIEIKEEWIVYGNYTEYVDEVVEELLDNSPDLEAIVFANDNMAKAGYRVCAARDLMVGHDIAITGFDDMDIAKSMKPPLTSVAHSSFLFSYEALQMALRLCRGEHPASREMEAFFHRRSSCGCKADAESFPESALSSEELVTYIEQRVSFITEKLYYSIPYEKEKIRYRGQLLEYFTYIREKVFEENGEDFSQEQLLRYLKKLCAHTYISKRVLQEFLSGLLDELVQTTDSENARLLLGRVIVSTEQYIYSQDVMELQTQIRDSAGQLWFLPSFTMDLVDVSPDFVKNMKVIMNRLAAINVRSTYFFLFEEPVICHEDENLCLPEDALIARIGGDEFVALVFPGDNQCINHLIDSLKALAKRFNESCEKPFYVEMSAGAHAFTNDGTDELMDLLSQSDQVLYQDKAKRRKSIKKKVAD